MLLLSFLLQVASIEVIEIAHLQILHITNGLETLTLYDQCNFYLERFPTLCTIYIRPVLIIIAALPVTTLD